MVCKMMTLSTENIEKTIYMYKLINPIMHARNLFNILIPLNNRVNWINQWKLIV